jgi:hypothetical protein
MPEEKSKSLQRVFTLMTRWTGANAKLWEYNVSHKSLVIRLEEPGKSGNLHLCCVDVDHICGPTTWGNALIKVTHRADGGFLIADEGADLTVIAADVEAAENCKPLN